MLFNASLIDAYLIDTYLWVAALAAFLVGLSKGGLPTIGMLAVPLLSLFMSPVKAAVLLLPIYVVSDVVGVWLYRRHFSAANLKILMPAAVLGVALGWLTAAYTSDSVVKLMIGGLGVGFCLHTWLRQTAAPVQGVNPRKGWFWGTVSGFTSFISHAGGPPFQIYMLPQRLPKQVFAGTSTLLFALINASKIWPYQQLQPYSAADLLHTSYLIPAALVGTGLGAYLTKRIADVWFYRFVQAGLFAVSWKLILDVVL